MKRCVFTMLCILSILICKAQSISPQKAQIVANTYWNTIYANDETPARQNTTSVVRTISPTNKALLYVVQMNDGWVLLSSEKAVAPILASSPVGVFPDYDDLPDGMKWLLSYYEDANQYARDSMNNIVNEKWELLERSIFPVATDTNSRDNLESSHVISRMAAVKWDQGYNNEYSCTKPYNAKCPNWYSLSCGRTLVGCGAVALGQILWYWQWPYSAIIPRRFLSMSDINTYSDSPYLGMYDWANIPSALYDTTDTYAANQLTYFLRDCGYAIKMKYDTDGSSSTINDSKIALENIFHYKPVLYRERTNIPSAVWVAILKAEISLNRPILYRGSGPSGGHAFVLFGYTSADMFRINWGWGGAYIDAVYSLDYLTPGNYNFSYAQAALIGIEPNSPSCSSNNYFGPSDVSSDIFEIQKSGMLYTDNTQGEIRISSNQTGCIYATDGIVINGPFIIESGAQVHIALQGTPCLDELRAPINSIAFQEEDSQKKVTSKNKNVATHNDFSISPNPATDYIEISSNKAITDVSLFNSHGICVLRSSNSFISISNLASGLYIVCARMEDGHSEQVKLLKK